MLLKIATKVSILACLIGLLQGLWELYNRAPFDPIPFPYAFAYPAITGTVFFIFSMITPDRWWND